MKKYLWLVFSLASIWVHAILSQYIPDTTAFCAACLVSAVFCLLTGIGIFSSMTTKGEEYDDHYFP